MPVQSYFDPVKAHFLGFLQGFDKDSKLLLDVFIVGEGKIFKLLGPPRAEIVCSSAFGGLTIVFRLWRIWFLPAAILFFVCLWQPQFYCFLFWVC